jgi:hypothetical protein
MRARGDLGGECIAHENRFPTGAPAGSLPGRGLALNLKKPRTPLEECHRPASWNKLN